MPKRMPPIVDAKVRIINVDTGAQSETSVEQLPALSRSRLLPGSTGSRPILSVLITWPAPADAAGGPDHRRRLVLQVGKQSETVNVTESAPLNRVAIVQYRAGGQSADVGRTAGCRTAQPPRWPLWRPGVVMIDRAPDGRELSGIQRGGGRARNQNFFLDGGECVERGRPDAAPNS